MSRLGHVFRLRDNWVVFRGLVDDLMRVPTKYAIYEVITHQLSLECLMRLGFCGSRVKDRIVVDGNTCI
jgi:hypothetical protein